MKRGFTPESIRVRLVVCGLVALGIFIAGCRSQRAPSSSSSGQETSVKPGVNAEFLKPDLNLTQWVERFEGEGREIYTQREAILSAAKVHPGATVADIGAGTGLFTTLLAQAVGPQGKV